MIFDYQIQDSETCYFTIKTDHIVPCKKRTVSFTNRTVYVPCKKRAMITNASLAKIDQTSAPFHAKKVSLPHTACQPDIINGKE